MILFLYIILNWFLKGKLFMLVFERRDEIKIFYYDIENVSEDVIFSFVLCYFSE